MEAVKAFNNEVCFTAQNTPRGEDVFTIAFILQANVSRKGVSR